MITIPIKIAALLLTAVFKLIGEKWLNLFQRIGIPLLLTATMIVIAIINNDKGIVWLALSIMGWIAIDQGYKKYGPNDQVARAAWLAVIDAAIWIVPTVTGHLDQDIGKIHISGWYLYVFAFILGGFVGRWVRKWNNTIGAPLNGVSIGWLILLFH